MCCLTVVSIVSQSNKTVPGIECCQKQLPAFSSTAQLKLQPHTTPVFVYTFSLTAHTKHSLNKLRCFLRYALRSRGERDPVH